MADILADVGTRYKALSSLGEGGMGSVLLVEDQTSGDRVALKLLNPKPGADAAAVENAGLFMKREFRAMSRFRHPNNCQVFDFGLLPDGKPYFTMELVEGKGLDELLPLPEADVLPILRQLCLALSFIHQQGFVHGDLKPENIRIRPDGVVKLMDFGLVDVAGTAHGTIRGTIAYMAPEVAKGGRIDQRSDIYALGAVAYHLLAGHPPFTSENAVAVLRAHAQAPVPPLKGACGPVSDGLQAILLRMLEKEPVARYQAVAEVLAALGVDTEESLDATLLTSEFVGRRTELDALQSALGSLIQRGEGTSLAVFGLSGVGKSRLLEEFRFSVQLENVPYYLGRAVPSRLPYGPFIQILKGIIVRAREVCPTVLADVTPVLRKLLPELGQASEAPAAMEPDQERLLIQSAITNLVTATLKQSGGVLVFEDWDLADPLSLETVTYLQRNLQGTPLLLLFTHGRAEATAAQKMEVKPFDLSEVRAMLSSMLGTKTLPDSLVQQLADWSDGVASRLNSLLEHLVRTGVFGKAKGLWDLPATVATSQLPSDVAEMFLARLADIGADARGVLDLIAVFGQPVPFGTVKQLSGLSEDVLLDVLDDLCQARVLQVDGVAYAYVGSEMREAVYQNLATDARAALHTRVAEALEERLPPEGEGDLDLLSTVARHHLAGQAREKAVRFALKAGEGLLRYSVEMAGALIEPGWALLQSVPEAEDLRSHYLQLIGYLYQVRHDLDMAIKTLDQARALAEQAGDKPRSLEILVYLAHSAQLKGGAEDLQRSAQLNERCIAIATEIGATRAKARALSNLGRALFFLGQNDRAREVFEEGVRFCRAEGESFYGARSACLLGYLLTLSPDTREAGLTHLRAAVDTQQAVGDKYGEGYTYMVMANVLLHSGMFKESEAATVRNAEIMRELGCSDDLAVALLNHALVLHERGDFARMQAVAEDCRKIALEVHHKVTMPYSGVLVCLAELYRGQGAGVLQRLRGFEAEARETSGYVLSSMIPYLIESLLYLGRLNDALRAAQEARDLVVSTGNTEIETRLWILMGEIHARLGETPAARSYFERAQEHGLKGHEPHVVVRAEKGLAWLDLTENRLDAAGERLTRAAEAARQLGMRHLRMECERLMGEWALAKGERPEALGYFQEAVDMAIDLGLPAAEAIAAHGMARANADPKRSARWCQQALAKLNELLEPLSADERDQFLSFTERAQLARATATVSEPAPAPVAGPIPEVSPAMPEDAPMEERTSWIGRELGHAASAAANEARRIASLVQEYDVMARTVSVQTQEISELQASNRRMEQLIRFSMAVSNLHDLDKILEQAVDMIVELTEAERGFLLFFENGQIRSQVSRVNVDRRPPLDWQFSKSIAEKVLSTGEVVCVFDALADQNFNQSQSVVDLNLRTVICVPMRVKGKVVGAIYVDRQSVNENFTPSDLEMVLSLAAQAAGAIENARLHQEWIDKSKRLEMLNHLSKTISSSLDMEEVLDLIVKMTLEVSRAERGFLFLVDRGSKLICRAARDTRSSLPLDQDHEVSQSICAKVLQTGEAENVADALNDEEFQFQQSIMALNLRMVMCVPIVAKAEVIGLLYVDSQAVVNAFGEKDLELLKAIAGHASVSIENAKLHAKTMQLADDLKKTFYSFVHALGASIDAKHPLTAGHSARVTEYSVRLARRIGLPEEEVENIRIAGLLHDVGKIGTPDEILKKPGSFTNEEYEIMKRHVVHTREILDNIHFPEAQRHIPAMAGAHHEKWDGKGYPNNQAGEEIPFGGRILALGDVFDAITSKRDYREAMPLSQALNIIRQGIGSHFDPELGPEFIAMIEEEGVVMYDKETPSESTQPQTAG
ncbi:MAG: HD domain-containing phosphohydrolase [Candidatus Sericytochromatia bacterium]|nr:HD domain-containing phosphohydrolase [Candidatus Sericytochromatia bacterium]